MLVNLSAQRKSIFSILFFIVCLLVLIFGGYFLVQGFLKKAPVPSQQPFVSSQSASIQSVKESTEDFVPLAIRDGALLVEVVTTESELARGLSGRPSLPQDRGMLFDLGEERTPSFWMKDMSFPLDIIWINNAFVVTDLAKNVSPASFPNMFSPAQPVRYVLETNAGFVDTFGISIGDRVVAPTIEKKPE
ncbi:DUF192 domain-containing protein [Candidatus Uhrbacteria bacterium]|nr:DUF192 domain-containing protein [Candidatus Uhrbacteria bacterium]